MYKHLCRAKRLDNNEWVYGYYVAVPMEYGHNELVHAIFNPNECEHVCMGEYRDYGWYEVDPKTVCRCIGWYDTYKKLIFERDIVEFDGVCSHRDLIWWNNEMSMIDAIPLEGIEFNGHDYWNGNYPKYTYSDFCLMMQDPWGDFKEIKVIGNAVDNPELLEVQK
ncbi:MAG: YopX family protein [Oscillospiraceae bacterium]|nr:YopX family protein [Oscillospiraceae bacterium]